MEVFNALEKTHIKEHYKFEDILDQDPDQHVLVLKSQAVNNDVMTQNSSRSQLQIAKNDLRLRSTQSHDKRNLSEKSAVLGPFNTSQSENNNDLDEEHL